MRTFLILTLLAAVMAGCSGGNGGESDVAAPVNEEATDNVIPKLTQGEDLYLLH